MKKHSTPQTPHVITIYTDRMGCVRARVCVCVQVRFRVTVTRHSRRRYYSFSSLLFFLFLWPRKQAKDNESRSLRSALSQLAFPYCNDERQQISRTGCDETRRDEAPLAPECERNALPRRRIDGGEPIRWVKLERARHGGWSRVLH